MTVEKKGLGEGKKGTARKGGEKKKWRGEGKKNKSDF